MKDKDRRKIQKLYLSGMKPEEIAQQLDMKPASLRQHLYREGLTKRRHEAEEARRRTAAEILNEARQQYGEEMAEALGELFAGLTDDAKRLRGGWDLVKDAAGASSLMRAKSLLLDRTLRTFGVEKPPEKAEGEISAINFFCLPASAARPLPPRNVTPDNPQGALG